MKISADKFNEITYAISQLQRILGDSTSDEATRRVFCRYPETIIAAYKEECARLDGVYANESDTPGTY